MATPLAPARVRAKVYTSKNVRFGAITWAAFAVISAVIAVVQFIDFLTGQ